MSGDAEEEEVRQRVRDAILKAGGVPTVAARTGISPKTLENYLAKRSTPSVDKAAKIAAAAGISVGSLTGEAPALDVSPELIAAAAEIVQLVGATVASVHRTEGVKLPEAALVGEISKAYAAMLHRMDDPGDLDEARSLIPWLETRLLKAIHEAAAAPGSGKREAS